MRPQLGPGAVKVALLAYLFCSELGAHSIGVVSTSLLVKRAGASYLPVIYLVQNGGFLPLLLLTLMLPPRSNLRLMRQVYCGYVAILVALWPAVGTSHPLVLGLLCVVSRVGKLLLSTFGIGMIGEILPIRETKALGHRMMAAMSAGIMAGGLLMKPTLTLIGMGGAYTMHLCLLTLGLICVLLLPEGEGASTPKPTAPLGPWGTVRETVRQALTSPLTVVIAGMEFFMVANRNVVNYLYASATGSRFASEQAMASFCGGFEAVMLMLAMCAQIFLSGRVMDSMRLGTFAVVFPLLLLGASTAALSHLAFITLMGCVCAYILGLDVFGRPARQILVAGAAGTAGARTPVLMALAGGLGSIFSSLALVPAARLTSPRLAVMLLLALSAGFLFWAVRAGRAYLASLAQSLGQGSSQANLSALGELDAEGTHAESAHLRESLEAGAAEVRAAAAHRLAHLDGPAAAAALGKALATEADGRVKVALLESLAQCGPVAPVSWILAHVDDPDLRIRATALEALGEMKLDEAGRSILLARSRSGEIRERTAALMALFRVAHGPEDIEIFADGLAGLSSEGSSQARAAAATIMGRLGLSLFFDDLVSFLHDSDPAVRRGGALALASLREPAAMEALDSARAVEVDASVIDCIDRCSGELRDGTIDSIIAVADRLTEDERRRIVTTLTKHRQNRILRLATGVLHLPGVLKRSELVFALRELRDEEILQQMDNICGNTEADPTDLLELLSHAEPGRRLVGYRILGHLVQSSVGNPTLAYVERMVAAYWRAVAAMHLLSEVHGEKPDREDHERRSTHQMQHVLAVSALFTHSPEKSQLALNSAMDSDRRRASVSVELLEEWLPERLRRVLMPLLETWGDAVAHGRRALERSGLGPATPVTECRAILARESR